MSLGVQKLLIRLSKVREFEILALQDSEFGIISFESSKFEISCIQIWDFGWKARQKSIHMKE